jgi:hypothetical protein
MVTRRRVERIGSGAKRRTGINFTTRNSGDANTKLVIERRSNTEKALEIIASIRTIPSHLIPSLDVYQ